MRVEFLIAHRQRLSAAPTPKSDLVMFLAVIAMALHSQVFMNTNAASHIDLVADQTPGTAWE